jgi:hypothetical protein
MISPADCGTNVRAILVDGQICVATLVAPGERLEREQT